MDSIKLNEVKVGSGSSGVSAFSYDDPGGVAGQPEQGQSQQFQQSQQPQQPQFPQTLQPQPRKTMDVKSMFAETLFDAYLTKPGMFFIGTMMGDDSMVEKAMPKTAEEQADFMDQFISFMTGEMDLVRSPEEAREFLGALRASSGNPTGKTGAKSVKKRQFAAPIVIT